MPRSNVKVVLRTRPCLLDQSHLVLDKAAKVCTAVTTHQGSPAAEPTAALDPAQAHASIADAA
jgi:hypothetical protein